MKKMTEPFIAQNSQIQQQAPSRPVEENNSVVNMEVQDNRQKQQPDAAQQCGQYEQYDEYGGYDQDNPYANDIMESQEISMYTRAKSSQNNTQCQMQDLVSIIEKDIAKVIDLSGFDRNWALIYYQACGWKMKLVETFIDQKLTSHHLVSYKPGKAFISSLNGTCDVCCQQNQFMIKNMCGDEFCQNCWKQHLLQRLKTFNNEPFPPCLNSQCTVKASPFILEQISKSDPSFKRLYLRTLCRSYAIGNSSVKMCKGKEKFSCDRCFMVRKLFQMIQCQCCGNIVCGRCGEQYHAPSQCFDGPNWRKVVEESTNFVQKLNYRICPSCKQAIQRSVGCNSVVCKCKHTFCYTCGESWVPNHSQHGVCYRQKEIRKMEEERKKKNENQKQYTDKLEKYKAEIQNYRGKIKRVESLDVSEIKNQLITRFQILSNQLDYLEPLRRQLVKALIIGKNYVLALYFNQDLVMKAELSNLTPLIEQCYDFLVYRLQDVLDAYREPIKMSKRAIQIRKEIIDKKFNPNQALAKDKLQILGITRNLDKYMHS